EAARVDERSQVLFGEQLGQAEVEEGHPTGAVEEVVAWMRIAVEGVKPVQAAEDEAVDGLGRQVLLILVPLEQLFECRARDELARQHARGAQLGQHVRNSDEWMAVVVVREQL